MSRSIRSRRCPRRIHTESLFRSGDQLGQILVPRSNGPPSLCQHDPGGTFNQLLRRPDRKRRVVADEGPFNARQVLQHNVRVAEIAQVLRLQHSRHSPRDAALIVDGKSRPDRRAVEVVRSAQAAGPSR